MDKHRHLKVIILLIALFLMFAFYSKSSAQEGSSLEDLARAAQDPLASISALVSDNTFSFGVGDDENTAYNFQIQGIYSINTDWGFNIIPRVIFPIVGAPQGAELPILEPGGGGKGTTWGLGDTIAQIFFAPSGSGNWKWGVGPQLSFATHTNSDLKGPDWGAGPAGVIIGSVGQFALGSVVGNLWSFDGDFNTLTIQPLVYYNFESVPGLSLGYNPTISADWKIESSDRWTVPLGLSIGKTFALGKRGHAVDISVGGFGVPIRPDGGPKAQLKVALFFIFPR